MISSRRSFLYQAAAAVAAVSLPAWAKTPAPGARRPRDFGFSLYGMKSVPLPESLEHLARIGYRQIELALMPGFPADPARFSPASRRDARARIQAHGLTLSSLMVNITLVGDDRAHAASLEVIKAAGELAHQLAGPTPPVIETIMGGKPDTWTATREPMAERLRAWGETARAADITLCVKAHAAHAVNSPDRLQWIVQRAGQPRLALAYDYSHFQFAGLELEATLRALLPQTRFVHLKDVAPNEPSPRFLLPGEGTIDYPRYFRLLDTLNYTGPAIVEVSAQISSRPGYDPVRTAEQCYAVLRRAAEA